jgi:hypothetical protein
MPNTNPYGGSFTIPKQLCTLMNSLSPQTY